MSMQLKALIGALRLVYEARGVGSDRLNDIDSFYQVLNTFPTLTGTTAVMPPYAFRYGTNHSGSGLSGFVLTDHGHMSVHTFPDRSFVSVDMLFPERIGLDKLEEVVQELRQQFAPERDNWQWLFENEIVPS